MGEARRRQIEFEKKAQEALRQYRSRQAELVADDKPWTHIHREEEAFILRARLPNEAVMDFEVRRLEDHHRSDEDLFKRPNGDWTYDLEEAQVFMYGYVKWDGCFNVTFAEGSIHGCALRDVKAIGKMLHVAYDMANKLIDGFEGYK